MKRFFSIILALALCACFMMNISAATTDITDLGKTVVDYGDWVLEKINGDTQWELDEYRGSDTEITTPRIIDDLLVVSFGDHCFANNSTVESVVTSSPLWTIGNYAFIDCKALAYFELNYALHTIGAGAFSGTSALKSINLQESVVTEILNYTFMNSGLESVEFPITCLRLGENSFAGCTALTKAIIPDSVTEIADTAFDECENLTIYANSGSYAIEYATEHDIPYVLLDHAYLIGDADGDGVVSISDVTLIQRVLAELEQDDDGMIELRVTNGDGKLNIFNATEIQRYLARLPIERTIDIPIIKSLV